MNYPHSRIQIFGGRIFGVEMK
jgi:hypothetical protein